MRDIKIDTDGFLLFDETDFETVTDKESIAQAITIRLQIWRGEYFRNINMGLDYMNEVFKKGYDSDTLKSKIMIEILAVEGVTKVEGISVEIVNNSGTITIDQITTDLGLIEGLEV